MAADADAPAGADAVDADDAGVADAADDGDDGAENRYCPADVWSHRRTVSTDDAAAAGIADAAEMPDASG